MLIPVELSNRESLMKSAMTSLIDKVVNQYSSLLMLLVVDLVVFIVDLANPSLLSCHWRSIASLIR